MVVQHFSEALVTLTEGKLTEHTPYAIIRAQAAAASVRPSGGLVPDHILVFVWRQWFQGVVAASVPGRATAQDQALSWCQPRTRQRVADGDIFVWLELRGRWIGPDLTFAQAGARRHDTLTLRIESSPWANLQGAQRIPTNEGSSAWTAELRPLGPGEDPRTLP